VKPNAKLSTSMTLSQFDNGYWYATELREFADRIGIPSANKLRKDELESAIKHFLRTGMIKSRPGRSLSAEGVRDTERGLRLGLPVVAYTNDAQTKRFLEREALKLAPGLKRRSGGALPAQSLARKAARHRSPDHLQATRGGIRSPESGQRALRADPKRTIHQFPERLLRFRRGRNSTEGRKGMESAQEIGCSQDLSRLGGSRWRRHCQGWRDRIARSRTSSRPARIPAIVGLTVMSGTRPIRWSCLPSG
jgi:hypothetical protein